MSCCPSVNCKGSLDESCMLYWITSPYHKASSGRSSDCGVHSEQAVMRNSGRMKGKCGFMPVVRQPLHCSEGQTSHRRWSKMQCKACPTVNTPSRNLHDSVPRHQVPHIWALTYTFLERRYILLSFFGPESTVVLSLKPFLRVHSAFPET